MMLFLPHISGQEQHVDVTEVNDFEQFGLHCSLQSEQQQSGSGT